jgi:GT2 family glycosyltransferase
MKYAPIVLFVYNRPEHTRKTVEALAENELAAQSVLYVFSDAPRAEKDSQAVEKVRTYIDTLREKKWFKDVIVEKAERNRGLAESIIYGVGKVVRHHGKVIVMEDDLLSAPDFLNFMNDALNFFENDERIGSISGYSPLRMLPSNYPHDLWIACRSSSLGWGTWKDRWEDVRWEIDDFEAFAKNKKLRKAFDACGSDRFDRLRRQVRIGAESWSIRFGYWQFRANKYTVFPAVTRIQHIGWDGSGVHGTYQGPLDTKISSRSLPYRMVEVEPSEEINRMLRKVYSGSLITRFSRFLRNNGLSVIDTFLRRLFKK